MTQEDKQLLTDLCVRLLHKELSSNISAKLECPQDCSRCLFYDTPAGKPTTLVVG